MDDDYTLLIQFTTCLLISVSDDTKVLHFDVTTGQLHFIKFGPSCMHEQSQTYSIMIISNLTRAMGTYLCILSNLSKKSMKHS